MGKLRRIFVTVRVEDPNGDFNLADVELREGFNPALIDIGHQFPDGKANESMAEAFASLVVAGIIMSKGKIRSQVKEVVLRKANEGERKEG